MEIPVQPWEPDKAEKNSGVSKDILNVLPGFGYYEPSPALLQLASTSALAGKPLGCFIAQNPTDNSYVMFAAANDGSVDRIYYYSGTSWADCSKSGGYGTADPYSGWQFEQYGNYVWAVSGANNAVQRIDLTDLPSGFNDVTGNGGTNPPRSRFIGIIEESLVFAGLTDFPLSVQYSGFGDSLEYREEVLGASLQTFPDGGPIVSAKFKQYGIILQETAVRRMTFDPGYAFIFRFTKIAENIGTTAVGALATSNARSFMILSDGFYMEAGGSLTPIGKGRINKTILADITNANLPYVLAAVEPATQRCFWAYPSSTQSDPYTRDKLLCYDPAVDSWTLTEQDLRYISLVANPGITLDDDPLASTPLEDVTPSLDDVYWQGGKPVLGGFDTANKVGTFSGASLEATIETGIFEVAAPFRAKLKWVKPQCDTTAVTVNVATRDRSGGTERWRTERACSPSSGIAYFEAEGRQHRVRCRIAAGEVWEKFQGFDAETIRLGM